MPLELFAKCPPCVVLHVIAKPLAMLYSGAPTTIE